MDMDSKTTILLNRFYEHRVVENCAFIAIKNISGVEKKVQIFARPCCHMSEILMTLIITNKLINSA